RITGTSDRRQDLAAPHPVSYLHAQTAWLQMAVIGKLPAAQVKRDCITCDRFNRNRYGRMELLIVSRNVVRKTVFCRNDPPIRNSQYGLAVGIVRMLVAGIA